MIIKKITQRIASHPWYFYLFNAFTVILSMMLHMTGKQFYQYIVSFGAELPKPTQWFIQSYPGLIALGIVAVGLSIYAYVQNQKKKNIDGIKWVSCWLMLFTMFCCALSVLAMYLPYQFFINFTVY